MTLEEIQQSIIDFILAAEENDDLTKEEIEVRDEFILAQLDLLADQESEKVDSYCFVIKKMEAECDFLKSEESRINAKQKSIEKQIERVKERIKYIMETHGLKKLSGRVHTIFLRTSKSVIIDCDPMELPDNYLRHIPEKFDPDKKAIGDALKEGVTIAGTRLEEKTSVQIR